MSKKTTHKEFVEKLLIRNIHFANNEFDICDEYVDNQKHLKCKCNKGHGYWSPVAGSLLRGSGCPECANQIRFAWKRIMQEGFDERMLELNNGVVALDPYAGYDTNIHFSCIHNHIWEATPHDVLGGHGCPYCAGLKVWIGFNDLWTTDPDVAKLLKNPEDGYKYSYGSGISVDFICPICGTIIHKPINWVYRQGLRCSHCSDGVSYPNKFARALLDQLHVDYLKCEYRPDWAKPYLYDNYFTYRGNEYILEMDGAFHYKERTESDRSLDEIRAIDEIKTELARQHGIYIIRIECIESDCEYIKNNIITSDLNDVFDLSVVDWDLCDRLAQNNLVKEVCNLYMQGIRDFNEISSTVHIHSNTVYNYLKRGAKFGWCNYDPRLASQLATEKASRPIALVDDNESVIHVFSSARACTREFEDMYGVVVYRPNIINACKTHKPYKGFNFRFANKTK